MNDYGFEDDDILTYDKYDIEVYDIDGEAVAFTDAMEDEDDAESLFEMLSVGAGGEIVLRKLSYRNPDYTGYLKTVIVKSKK